MDTIQQDKDQSQPSWEELLKSAVTEPGKVSEAYSMFHNYSLGNQLLAMFQCSLRGLKSGPIATFPGWKEKGRFVKAGSKAITLCMPVTGKKHVKDEETGEDKNEVFTYFIYKRNWFVLCQTDGEPFKPEDNPAWNRAKALETLGIAEGEFSLSNGNVMGYAQHKEIAINPLNPRPDKTRFHELAHILLGHTSEGGMESDESTMPRNLKETEAESVALLCLASLNMPGQPECRGYIQNWYGQAPIPEKSAQRVFKVADTILKAGI